MLRCLELFQNCFKFVLFFRWFKLLMLFDVSDHSRLFLLVFGCFQLLQVVVFSLVLSRSKVVLVF